ncbi:hypothetical protein BDM02DRAFT_3107990 [Thelephora ganbajun]|uniref:Uncharacterized protein n=1 Tax=Thelephora ganbajun TaxID=370292 RepID=A0ACB6ZVE6_THEGA|nr:hypothetical protein BDM02DRAFT_3107990 [Thelephora ganbajun]
MDRPVIHRSSLPQSWVQHYPPSAPPNPSHPRPLAVQYPYDPRNDYTAPTLYPNVVSQQFPHRYSQPPLPNTLIPGGVRPRARSTIGDNNFSLENPPPVPQFPPFPSISPPQSSHGSSFPRTPVPPSKPPALQSQLSGYPLPVTNQRQSEVPIRPPPISARRSSSSPAINRIPTSGQPPPVPPLPPNYHSGYLQHAPQHVSPPPLSSIPVPSVYQPYRSDLSPLYASPHEIVPPPLLVPQTNASSLPKSHSDEEAELALAISISERESKEQSGQISQEERDLAKAIEESIRHASSFGMPVPYTDPGPSTLPATISPLSFPTPSPVAESPLSSHTSLASPNTPHLSASRPTSKASSPLMYPAQPRIDDDEALAEQLADEEERVAAGRSNPPLESPVLLSAESGIAVPVPALSPTSRKRHDAHRPMLTVVGSEPPPPLYHQVVSAQTSAPTKTSPTSPNVIPSLGRSSSATVVTPSSSRLSPIPGDPERPNNGRSQSLDAVPSSSSNSAMNTSVSARPNPLPIMEESADSPLVQSPSPSSVPATLSPTPNSFIDQQLLDGICRSLCCAKP